MSWHLVDGVPLPDPVGGHPALDFCNTRAGWSSPHPKEYLPSPRALALWAVDADLVLGSPADGADGSPDRPEQEAEALRRALGLRESLYRCFLGRGDPADWALVSDEIVAARGASTLVAGEAAPLGPPGPVQWRLATAQVSPATAALHAAAGAAEDLLRSPLGSCVAACPGQGCGWLFADRRRRRRWCSMAVCGNRAKARRHAARRP